MTRYQVDTDQVLTATQTARSTIDRLHQDVASLSHTLTTLQSCWSGQASQAFTEVYASWRTTQSHVESQLTAITHALGQAGQHYLDMEMANAALFRR